MAASVVVIEPRERAREVEGPAIGAADPHQLIVHLKINFLRPLDVIADKQIEFGVVVIIDPSRAGAPVVGGTAHACLRGYLAELSVSGIAKQMIASDRGDEHVVQSVVVVIAHRDAHTVTAQVQAGPGGYIGEMTVAVVMVERHGGRLFALRDVAGPPGGIDEKQVAGAVIVKVEKSHTPAYRFRQQFVAVGAMVVYESNPGFFSKVGEPGGRNLVDG